MNYIIHSAEIQNKIYIPITDTNNSSIKLSPLESVTSELFHWLLSIHICDAHQLLGLQVRRLVVPLSSLKHHLC